MWYRSNRNGYICGAYARHGSKACSSHTVKEVFLTKTILSDIKMWVDQIDKDEYVRELEGKSKRFKLQLQKQLDKLTKDIDTLKKRKREFINLLADELITQKEYREIVDTSNTELDELVIKKNELISEFEHEDVAENLSQLKSELLSFLNFDDLTSEMLHRLVNRIEVREDGIPRIHYRFSAPNN